MQSFDKTSFDELLGELDKEFQRLDSGELMIDTIFSNDAVGRVDGNSFPGFTAEEQRTIMEKFTMYQAHAHAVANQTPQEPSINHVQAASIKQPAIQPTLFQIMGNPIHRHPQALASGGFAAFSALPQPHAQPRSSSFSQHPTFQRLQGQAGGSRPKSGPLPYVGGEGRVSPESARASPSSPSIKRRQPSDDEEMSSGRYSPSTISPANSFRDATKRPSPGPLGTSPPTGYVMPRSSLAQLGVVMSEGGSDEGDMTDEKRKKKNRIAQRKHRDKQKNQFTTLQSQLDAKDAQLDAKDAQLQTAVALIQDLTTKLQLYQSTFGPLPQPSPLPPPHT